MAPIEVIGAGFGRTGTDSLHLALNILGYNTHHMKSFFADPTLDTDDFYDAYLHPDETDWDKLYENYSAGVDWPTCSFYKELMVKYPNAKVLLTTRTPESWYKSVVNTIASPTLLRTTSPKFRKMLDTVCVDGLLNDPVRLADKEKVMALFADHNNEVKAHVPADRLLVMELGEGWERLCKFLGKEVPNTPYPSSNSTEHFNKLIREKDAISLLA
ncbi:P-loop containing nucleoside triphosphate hydrolase protein [Helicostylum pulchrum]|nr:P-loop containing nucleoside triphosphate hydrolase protein [Helicostylum pulchrum]